MSAWRRKRRRCEPNSPSGLSTEYLGSLRAAGEGADPDFKIDAFEGVKLGIIGPDQAVIGRSRIRNHFGNRPPLIGFIDVKLGDYGCANPTPPGKTAGLLGLRNIIHKHCFLSTSKDYPCAIRDSLLPINNPWEGCANQFLAKSNRFWLCVHSAAPGGLAREDATPISPSLTPRASV